MNYRHDFHAGNFADVFKHIFLTRILFHLEMKPTAFRYIETHAGSALYDLLSLEAGRTTEWRRGIGKLVAAKLSPEVQLLVAPYLRIATPLLRSDFLRYSGSPWIARAMLRRQDRMILCELHPRAFARLSANLHGDARAKLFNMDGYKGLSAFIPPIERRGLVLIDPPFEDMHELTKALDAMTAAWRKWATGIFMLWYPVKDIEAVASMTQILVLRGVKRVLRLEFQIDEPKPLESLVRSGLIIVNPPFRLDIEADVILPWLADCLGVGLAAYSIDWLSGE